MAKFGMKEYRQQLRAILERHQQKREEDIPLVEKILKKRGIKISELSKLE